MTMKIHNLIILAPVKPEGKEHKRPLTLDTLSIAGAEIE